MPDSSGLTATCEVQCICFRKGSVGFMFHAEESGHLPLVRLMTTSFVSLHVARGLSFGICSAQ